MVNLRTRQTGATAQISGQEKPLIRSLTGGEIMLETSASAAGFNAIDLLYASLAACLVMSARIAARQLGVSDQIRSYQVQVTGEKTAQEPYRISGFEVVFSLDSDLDDALMHHLAEQAEAMCTVSNTLKSQAEMRLTIQ